jgi:DNA-directed RNA polymerase specialized sigma subunit
MTANETTDEIILRPRTAMERAKYAGDKIARIQDQILTLSMVRRDAVRELARTMTYREIGAELGISAPRVSQIVGKGWKKPPRKKKRKDAQ